MAHHLRKAERHERLYALICKPWFELKLQHASVHAFVDDLDVAISVALAQSGPEALVQTMRLSTVESVLQAVGDKIPDEWLGLLIRIGQVSRAKALVAAADPIKRSHIYLDLAQALGGPGYGSAARSALAEAFEASLQIAASVERAKALSITAEHFAGLAERTKAREAATLASAAALAGREENASATFAYSDFDALFEHLISVFVEVGEYDRALALVQEIRAPLVRAHKLIETALRLAPVEGHDRSSQILDQALHLTASVSKSPVELSTLRRVAVASIKLDQAEKAFRVVRKIGSEHGLLEEAVAMTEVGLALVKAGSVETALAAAQGALKAGGIINGTRAGGAKVVSEFLIPLADLLRFVGEPAKAQRTLEDAFCRVLRDH